MEDMPSKDFERNDFEQEIQRLKAAIETSRQSELEMIRKVPSLPVAVAPPPAAAAQGAGAAAGGPAAVGAGRPAGAAGTPAR